MRKRKWVAAYLAKEDRYLVREENYRERWLETFKKKELYLEIGMGMGDFITQSAALNPDILYVGVEKEAVCVARAAKAAKEKELNNLRIIYSDALNLTQYFAKEVARIYLSFPDPWPKRHHAKRRLTAGNYLALYQKVLKDGGELIFKSDKRELYEFTLETIKTSAFTLAAQSEDYHALRHDDILTAYEAKFIAAGQPIYYLRLKCRS